MTIAWARGCSEFFSTEAAICKTFSFVIFSLIGTISVTLGSPRVNVPVLSKITTLISLATSSALPLLIKIPFLAASPVPIITAVGVANPKTQGQAMIKTVTKTVTAKASGCPTRSQVMKARIDSAKTVGTK